MNLVNSNPPVVSKGEGHPASLRIIMDEFTGFVEDQNAITTNYTGKDNYTVTVTNETARLGSFIDVEVNCKGLITKTEQ